MSATVNATITISSSDLTSDVISLSVLNSLASQTQGGINREKIAPTVIGSSQVIADKDLYTQGARVWLYNPSALVTTEKIYVSFDGTSPQIILSGGDWAVIPWSAGDNGIPEDLFAYSETANNILEFGIFN